MNTTPHVFKSRHKAIYDKIKNKGVLKMGVIIKDNTLKTWYDEYTFINGQEAKTKDVKKESFFKSVSRRGGILHLIGKKLNLDRRTFSEILIKLMTIITFGAIVLGAAYIALVDHNVSAGTFIAIVVSLSVIAIPVMFNLPRFIINSLSAPKRKG